MFEQLKFCCIYFYTKAQSSFKVTYGQKFCMVQICVAILETLHSTHGKQILKLRRKICLLKFLCLDIKFLNRMNHKALPRLQHKTGPCRVLVCNIAFLSTCILDVNRITKFCCGLIRTRNHVRFTDGHTSESCILTELFINAFRRTAIRETLANVSMTDLSELKMEEPVPYSSTLVWNSLPIDIKMRQVCIHL